MTGSQQPAAVNSFSASLPASRSGKQCQDTPWDKSDDESVASWSPSPSLRARLANIQQRRRARLHSRKACRDLAVSAPAAKAGPPADNTAGHRHKHKVQHLQPASAPDFTPESVRAKLAQAPSYPAEQDQQEYTAGHPLIYYLRNLLRNRSGLCTLCAMYQWGPIVYTHKLKHCQHRAESDEARPWLQMFQHYQAQGGGAGARCAHCRFPAALCWRTVYRERMDAQYGNEEEARAGNDVWYKEVQCSWAKTIQQFVTGCMVVGGGMTGTGVSEVGATVLGEMGWRDWRGLEENGPGNIQAWLEETDVLEGLRCPRLLKLFWLLVSCT